MQNFATLMSSILYLSRITIERESVHIGYNEAWEIILSKYLGYSHLQNIHTYTKLPEILKFFFK